MDSYIVRIYRREPDASKSMLGVAVGVDGNGDQPFCSTEQLWDILADTPIVQHNELS
jgi:hypothetical protein